MNNSFSLRLLEFLKVGTRLTLTFILLYGSSNWLAMKNLSPNRFYFYWELSIPFVPFMILPYTSLNLLNLLPLFFLKPFQIRGLGKTMMAATIIAFVIFVLFPAPVGFTREIPEGIWSSWYEILYTLDKQANSLPSLHITYSFLVIRSIDQFQKLKWLWIWFIAICLSVLMTHQHHILDIISGMILAEFCFRKYFEGQRPS